MDKDDANGGITRMDKKDANTLRRERDYIAKEVARCGAFADVVYELKERDVLQPDDAAFILNLEATKESKIRNLLNRLEICRLGTFQVFMEVLIQFDMSHIVKRLDPRAHEHYGGILGGEMDKLDAERMPDFHGVGESRPSPNAFRDLPTLPPRNSGRGSFSGSDNNGNDNYDVNKPLKIKVKQASELGGSHHEPSTLYRNQSMPRGLVFLANYKNFSQNEYPDRDGSEKDVSNLSKLFTEMGYKIPQKHENLTKYDTIKALREFKNLEEHDSVDSCVVIIMSHGRDERSFYTSDNQWLTVNDVVERFNNLECQALKGKPKIFIFQYCRGKNCDTGVAAVPRQVKWDGALGVQTDAAYTSVVDRDPTFTDMYIVYSTVEGFVSFRHPERGSWLMEAICNVFMNNAHDQELDTLMKMVSRQVRQNLTDEGNKQVCEFVQRAFDQHFYFNPQHQNSTERLSMRALTHALSESVDSLEGAASPVLRRLAHHRQLRPVSWSRGSTPDPYGTPTIQERHRNLSGASNSSDYNSEEISPTFFPSGGVTIHPRARRRSGNQRHTSEVQFLGRSHLPDHLDAYNRSFSEDVLGSSPDPGLSAVNDVFIVQALSNPSSPAPSSYDTVDHSLESSVVQETEAAKQVEKSDVNMNEAASCEMEEDTRHSIKRQLSFPSTNETLTKLNDVKKFLQVHDSNPEVLERLQRVESFVNKTKGKRRKKDNEPSSLEY